MTLFMTEVDHVGVSCYVHSDHMPFIIVLSCNDQLVVMTIYVILMLPFVTTEYITDWIIDVIISLLIPMLP